MSWKEGELTHWSPLCLKSCFQYTIPCPCVATLVESPRIAKTSIIPCDYQDPREVFSKEKDTHFPHHRPGDCSIDLPNVSRIYSLSLPENKAMEKYIEEALHAGYIQSSTSPAAAGFFFVEKKDGGLPPCIDYRGLNALTIRYPYPLPLVPAALEQIREAQYSITKIINIRSPNEVFKDLPDKYVITYIDILIYSRSYEDHIRHVCTVLACLLKHQLYVKAEKCESTERLSCPW
ncbi:hypothetical protein QTP86_031583, partial [Hemibagrus guttatus]